MPGVRYSQLAERAAKTFGYLTADDARELGIPVGTLNTLSRDGDSWNTSVMASTACRSDPAGPL